MPQSRDLSFFLKALLIALLCFSFTHRAMAEKSENSVNDGLAPEVTDLNAKDVSFEREKNLPYLKESYISVAPRDRMDDLVVGELGRDGGHRKIILDFAHEIAKPEKNDRVGNTDSFLISYKGKLIFESYYRRGRVNYPHYQMSITKAYSSTALGRAIQLGYLKMSDLDKPIIHFLKELDISKLAAGAEKITLDQAMTMRSGIRLSKGKVAKLQAKPDQLKGQGQIQAYLENSAPIPDAPRPFKYQGSDPCLIMQVLAAVIPGGDARAFIQHELLGKLGIQNYHWQTDLSGLPKSAAGSSMRSRDMIKIGQMVLAKGKWQGEQLVPAAFLERGLKPLAQTGKYGYGYFWWVSTVSHGGKTYQVKAGRGAGGQYLFMFPALDLVAVITSHNKGMGRMRDDAPKLLLKAFVSAN